MKYEVTMPFGNYKVGQVVDDSDRYIRRKIAEGGCLKALTEKSKGAAPNNKSIGDAPKNKGVS